MIHVEQHGPVVAIRMSRSFLGRPFWWTAAYWVDGVLIDAGPRRTAAELLRALKPYPVHQIVITHGHEDHTGGLVPVRTQYPLATVYAAPRTLPLIQEPQRIKMQTYRRILWGRPQAFADVVSLDAVDNVIQSPNFRLRVVETPGHSPDHITLFEPTQRWAFCGDAFTSGRDETWAPEYDMFGIISSLRTLASLRPERLFPGDGRVSRTPLPEIHDKIGQLIKLTREVARLDAAGQAVPEIVTRLFSRESAMNFWTRGHYSATHLVEACRSYTAIFAPLDDHDNPHSGQTPSAREGSDSSEDTTDENTTDLSDWIR